MIIMMVPVNATVSTGISPMRMKENPRIMIVPTIATYGALEMVWNEIKDSVPERDHEKERKRIAYMVAGFAPLALDKEDLTRNVLFHLDQGAAA